MDQYLIEAIESNDKVVLPALGAFVIKERNPNIISLNEFFKFNSAKVMIDFIAKKDGIDANAAKDKLKAYVQKITKAIESKGLYEIKGLGLIGQDTNKNLVFKSEGQGIKNPTEKVQKNDTKEAPKSISGAKKEDIPKTRNKSIDSTIKVTSKQPIKKSEVLPEKQNTKPVEPKKSEPKKAESTKVVMPPPLVNKDSKPTNKIEEKEIVVVEKKERKSLLLPILLIILLILLCGASYYFFYAGPQTMQTNISNHDALVNMNGHENDVKKIDTENKAHTSDETDNDFPVSKAGKDAVQNNLAEEVEKIAPKKPSFGLNNMPINSIDRYFIVVGCFTDKPNADKLVKQLKEGGYKARNFGSIRSLHAVAVGSFNDKAEGIYMLYEVRKKFNVKAWLYDKEKNYYN